MSWLTGQVLDLEVLSKHCPDCKMREASNMSEEDWEAWEVYHEGQTIKGLLMLWK